MSAEIEGSQWWPIDQLREFQGARLSKIIESVVWNVPYYRDRYQNLGMDISRLRFPEEIDKLPLMDKMDVRKAGKALISKRASKALVSGSTSGTTGTPLTLYQDLAAVNRENAFIWRQLAWAGLRRGARRAWLRGDMIVPVNQQHPPYWRKSHADSMLMLSSYHLSEATTAAYIDALARFDPVIIQAYPSSIGFLASWMESSGLFYRGESLRGIVTSSEFISDEQRAKIENTFGCKVFDWYGQFERVAAIGTCEHGRYHLISDYSHVELLPGDDGLFELVGTGFNNMAMPLIRYRCGDLVLPAPADERCACGRSFPLINKIVGRTDDSIKLPNGRRIGRLDHLFKGVSGILEAQIRQDRLDALTILMVPSSKFNQHTRNRVLANARERLGEEITLELAVVDSIPRTKSGKFRGVICNV
ncbi:phenylacetate--CoA ligase family protein [Methylocaldum sp.]|uniref:phenylacetate--CoA ligase family protein n=1 Tax=Methylocaldum sp. TaxID=1969727 RepID=UPI002D76BEB9|nr:phenylacetate--CoA ligase family protein [Methylocaldum sp.]